MTTEPQKIVVGVDFSPESEVACHQALAIARRSGAELVLVHAGTTVEVPSLSADASESARRGVAYYRQFLADRLHEVRGELDALRARLSGQGAQVSQLVVEDFADSALCAVASELDARLTVVGTHGRTGLRWLTLGSVARSVVRHSVVDALVTRPPRSRRDAYQRVLVATDFSSSAERALDAALSLAADDARVDVVHCIAAPAWSGYGGFGMLEPLPADLREALLDDLRRQGEARLARRRRPGLDLRLQVVSEPPVPGILHRLEAHPYDLAALGSHGRRGLKRALLGSVAESTIQRAPCSVLVARRPSQPTM